MVSTNPEAVFVNNNNTVYIAANYLQEIQMWPPSGGSPIKTFSGSLSYPTSVFVTINGDVYADNGYNGRVEKWATNATNSVTVMTVPSYCYSLFVDINDNLYCSLEGSNVVVKESLQNAPNTPIIVAGNSTSGNAPNMLNSPYGIFVTINLSLYVADFGNNRIQLFQLGQSKAITVVGSGAPGTFTLSGPAEVVLDFDGYLFIADYLSNRIIGSGPNGFRCVAGCSGSSGSSANKLYNPRSLSFDTYGNLFVDDRQNNRIQKFLLANNSCGNLY
jgi:tripartite motif-containing protein 71